MNLGICKYWWILVYNYSIIFKDNKVLIMFMCLVFYIFLFYIYNKYFLVFSFYYENFDLLNMFQKINIDFIYVIEYFKFILC